MSGKTFCNEDCSLSHQLTLFQSNIIQVLSSVHAVYGRLSYQFFLEFGFEQGKYMYIYCLLYQLLNGNNAASPPLMNNNNNGRLCGTSAPSVPETASNNLFVSFVSDGSSARSGFSLTWSEVTVSCGGSLSLSAAVTSGVFSSPNYPAVYPHNVDCIWVITAPASESIQIDFASNFNIENHSR